MTHYHVVCHDCTVEELEASGITAKSLVRTHEQETGHNVEVAEI